MYMIPRTPKTSGELQGLLLRDHTLNGGILFGLDGYIIEIQARAMSVHKRPIPWSSSVKLSGMAKASIAEAMDRISGAFAKLRIPEPQVSIQINLIPPTLEKDGTWLDLPLAIIILQAAGFLPDLPEHVEGDYVLAGELGLHGEVRRVPGMLAIAMRAKPGQKLIVPAGNEKECALILAKPGHEGCGIYPVSSLEDVIGYFQGTQRLENALRSGIRFENHISKAPDFGVIRGQARAKEAACIAAAGGHNLLLIGPPGEGKSLLASAIPGILPRLSDIEKVELTRIYSAQGALEQDGVAVTRRPMRSIHHTASKQSLIGGGSRVPKPGEITLAHLGILFLDEIAEFSSSTLESLRQPLESGEVSISRVGASLTFPCRFALVAAMNPCPCGYFGTDRCRCREAEIKKYQQKLSGPILDRIDLQVEMDRLTTDERFAEAEQDVSPRLRSKVESARVRQIDRFKGTDIPFNAAIPAGRILDFCKMTDEAKRFFRETIDRCSLSTRSMDRFAKVSRTIADLAASEHVEKTHISKAAEFVIGGVLRESF